MSLSVNQYCATASAGVCSEVPAHVNRCDCAGQEMTPVYADEPIATATGCEKGPLGSQVNHQETAGLIDLEEFLLVLLGL